MSIKKNTIWNLLGSFTPLLLGLAAVPFILERIGVERLGVLTLIWAAIGYFSIFDFGLGRALTQQVSKKLATGSSKDCADIVQLGLLLLIVAGVIGACIVLIAVFFFGVGWLNSSDHLVEELTNSLLVVALVIPVTTLTSGLKGILEGCERFDKVNLLKFILGLANFAAPVASIFVFGDDLLPIVISLAVARGLILLLHVLFVLREGFAFHNISFSGVRNANATELVSFGSWMTVSNLVSPLMVLMDRFFVSSIAGAAVVAFYSVPSDFLLRGLILPAAITTAAFPVFVKKMHTASQDVKALYKNVLWTIFWGMSMVAFGVILFGGWGLNLWLGAEFSKNSYGVSCVLVVGILFNSLAQVPHSLIQSSGNAKLTSLVHLAEFVVYIPMLYGFIHYLGILGAAYAWLFRALLDFLLLHYFAARIMQRPSVEAEACA